MFVGVFSLSQTKQDLYIFPVVPAVAALVADALVAAGFGRTQPGCDGSLLAVAALAIVARRAVDLALQPGYYQLASVGPAALLLILGGLRHSSAC